MAKADKPSKSKASFISRLITKIMSAVNYCMSGVWNDPRRTAKVKSIKILNLTINSFFDRDLQIRSMALTYSTVLSIVPAFALLVAIGRGFGLQDTLQSSIYGMFPSQAKVISTALTFVDSYLTEATQGVFVGVGILVLLWTVISLLQSIEDSFNNIWGIRQDRTLFQKIADYIAICLVIPVLMICSSGVSIFMSTTVQEHLNLPFLTPFVNFGLELAPLILVWAAFTMSFAFIPNEKVNIKYAAISGLICAVGFQILQLLFLNGQIYVSKYNAIYGSFSFLPLMLIWLQMSWLLVLTGCVLTYSLQNVLTFNFLGDGQSLSTTARRNLTLIVMTVCTRRFLDRKRPLSTVGISTSYNLPIRAVGHIVETLKQAGLVYEVDLQENEKGLVPAVDMTDFSVARLYKVTDSMGKSEFMPGMKNLYGEMLKELDPVQEKAYSLFADMKIADIPLPTPTEIKEFMLRDSAEKTGK
ncbi:MAG: YihY/virulence factor BrkB family protein [Muribaculaceae bacterium]|nr:YihY/virulence factor BrkB family protein [Muribaculaceae bacterium]